MPVYIKTVLGNTTLVISNDEIEDIVKIIKYLEDFAFLLEGLLKQFKMK